MTFTPADAANYNGASANVPITVDKAAPTITWSNPADIVYGTALGATQLNATANVAGTFGYTPAAGTVLNAGSHTLSVTFTPTDAANYNGASANVLDHRHQGDADDHLGEPGGHRLRHRARRDRS